MKFNIFEFGIFSFNLYVYFLTRGFIASARTFNLLTSAFNLPICTFNAPTRAFNLATRAFSFLTRGFKLVTRGFKHVSRRFELVTCGFELVTRVLHFHRKKTALTIKEKYIALKDLEKGITKKNVAEKFSVPQSTLTYWIKQKKDIISKYESRQFGAKRQKLKVHCKV